MPDEWVIVLEDFTFDAGTLPALEELVGFKRIDSRSDRSVDGADLAGATVTVEAKEGFAFVGIDTEDEAAVRALASRIETRLRCRTDVSAG